VGLELEAICPVLVPVFGRQLMFSRRWFYTGPFVSSITKADRRPSLSDRGDLPKVRAPLVAKDSVAAGGFYGPSLKQPRATC